MARIHQALLETPNTKFSPSKILYVLLSFISLIGLIAFVSLGLFNVTSTTYQALNARVFNSAHDSPSCVDIVSELTSDGSTEMNEVDLLRLLLQKSTSRIEQTIEIMKEINAEEAALADCLELMAISKERIAGSIRCLENLTPHSHFDAHTWLSSVLTNHVTCLDGLNGPARPIMEPRLTELIIKAETSLDMVVAISPKSLTEVLRPLHGDFPAWVSSRDRKLLTGLPKEIKPNVVVAKDGSGDYTTVQEAIDSAPKKSEERYVIYIKKGTYNETVRIATNKQKLTIIGDGMNSTIITGNLYYVANVTTTFNTATVAATGDGFIAQDIWFQNTAGPENHQAVALRIGADHSVINRCRIDAYQDTLYVHSNRQFYRDCQVTGTVDFIFGNAAVVLQNSILEPRKPMKGQSNMLTAQSRTDPNQNTGISIQNCTIVASADLKEAEYSVSSYLGRPWKNFSRAVVLESYISDVIDPAGWSEWSGDLYLDTLYYGEYMNRGPGAGTAKRVQWPGYHVITSAEEASKFTVAELLEQGTSWLKNTGVAYTEGLIS